MRAIALEKLKPLKVAWRWKTRSGNDPKYVQVFAVFTEAIRRGDFKPGRTATGHKAELCTHLPVSLGTVQKAMSSPVAFSGLVVRNRRTGTFVADRRSQASEAFVFRFKLSEDRRSRRCPSCACSRSSEDRFARTRAGRSRRRNVACGSIACCGSSTIRLYSRASISASYHGKILLDTPIEELHGSSNASA